MGKPSVDLTNRVVGLLTVLGRAPSLKGHARWLCACSCSPDAKTVVLAYNLKNEHTTSCGCKNRRLGGASKTRAYKIWHGMMHRCGDPAYDNYHHYGGRGIKVCERWKTFANFQADMGVPPPDMTLDRINNNVGYEPFNCRWATKITQMRNKTSNVVLELCGERRCLTEWAGLTGLRRQTIQSRLRYGWTAEKALTTPSGRPNNGRANNISKFVGVRRQ